MTADAHPPVISVMLAVSDAAAAAAWYAEALGATELWNLGGGVGLDADGAAVFLSEPTDGLALPGGAGAPTAGVAAPHGAVPARVELFVADPDAFVRRALAAGADGSADAVRDHEAP